MHGTYSYIYIYEYAYAGGVAPTYDPHDGCPYIVVYNFVEGLRRKTL